MKSDFPEIETIKAMTDTVIEIRLAVPQPAILELLAQPSMAIVSKGIGWGPMRARKIGRAVLLSPVPDPLAEQAATGERQDGEADHDLWQEGLGPGLRHVSFWRHRNAS